MTRARQLATCITAHDLQPGQNLRPQPIIERTYEAFRLLRDGEMRPEGTAETFEECRDACAIGTPHKQQFAVRVTDLLSGAVTLHVFQMREGPRQYHGVIEGYVRRRYPDPVSVIRIVEPTYPDEIARVVGLPLGRERPVANEVAL